MSKLWAVTCYFNPMRYARRFANYLAFRRHLTIPLVTVELAYDETFELPADAAEVMVRLRGRDVLWQKERLLNVALERLPADCDAVAWLDCDVVFDDRHWAALALRALDRVALLQPFHRVREPNPGMGDAAAPCGLSLAHLLAEGVVTAEILRGDMRVAHRVNAGLAWAARRDVLERDGFYDACVMGSGNRAMACAALGRPDDAVAYLCMTPQWERQYRAWAARHHRSVGGRIGFIEGTLTHLWHGDLADRRYGQRHREFAVHGFVPGDDIAMDEGGAWRWSSRKPAMHACVAAYFECRREDGAAADSRRVRTADSFAEDGATQWGNGAL